jgi:dethiobiotin synthetase
VADLANDLGFPLVVVAPNVLGTINHVLQTCITAATFRDGLDVAGIVLNQPRRAANDLSAAHNAREIRRRAVPPLVAEVAFGAERFEPAVDWYQLAAAPARREDSVREDEP